MTWFFFVLVGTRDGKWSKANWSYLGHRESLLGDEMPKWVKYLRGREWQEFTCASRTPGCRTWTLTRTQFRPAWASLGPRCGQILYLAAWSLASKLTSSGFSQQRGRCPLVPSLKGTAGLSCPGWVRSDPGYWAVARGLKQNMAAPRPPRNFIDRAKHSSLRQS